MTGAYQLLPPLTYDEYQALKADIAARGVLVPVEQDEAGNVLDGHHRLRAAAELGLTDYPVVVRAGWTEAQKRAHVLALNVHRRHLTREQRRALVLRLRADGWSTPRIGAALGVDHSTVVRDLASAATCADAQVDLPERIVGLDGRERPAARAPQPGVASVAVQAPADDDEPLERLPAVIDDAGAADAAAPPVPSLRRVRSQAERYAERMAAPDPVADAPEPLYGAIATDDALAYLGDLPDGSAHACVTSPPYWAKREYVAGDPRELGKERHPEDYVDHLCEILNEVGRVLTPRGVLFLNLGDTRGAQPGRYRGDPNRRRGISNLAVRANGTALAGREHDLADDKTWCLVPETVLLRLALDSGWLVVSKIVWRKVGHGPENVYDRLTQAWEPVYVLARHRYPWFWGAPDGTRAEDVWEIAVGRRGAAAGHLAPFPERLVERALRHACPGPAQYPGGGVVLDPFAGSGTTLAVATRLGRRFLGTDLAPGGTASPSLRTDAGDPGETER